MGLFTPNLTNLQELYTTKLKKALNMERQIVEKGLPTMIENATSPELQNAFRTHLEESREQQTRLEQILQERTGDVDDASCPGIKALISEGSSDASDAKDAQLRDVVLISGGNEIEHHEIAVYGTLINWANVLGEAGHASLLEKSLAEEKNADKLLTQLAEQINVGAPVA
jgi:ferritin-like metal-binding protein YciE